MERYDNKQVTELIKRTESLSSHLNEMLEEFYSNSPAGHGRSKDYDFGFLQALDSFVADQRDIVKGKNNGNRTDI